MLTEKTMLELSDMLAGGTCSAVDIAKAYLERIETLNPRLNAFITVDPERTLREARESDDRRAKGQPLSRLDGIPVAIKDNICTEDLRTTCASGMLRDFVPTYNATSYRKMRAAGLVTLGKTNMDEFAMGSTSESSFFGPVRNPWNTDCVPGGSSGGSAVAVAARMAPVALGSDTGGSIRQPASFCGVVGIKPTYGRVSRFGLVAYASSLDQIGTFARTSADAAALLEVISGHDTGDSTSVDHGIDFGTLAPSIKGLKLGMPVEYFNGLPESIAAVIKQRIEGLKARGAEIIDISLKLTEYAIPAYYLIATAEASSNLARFDGIR